MNYYYVNVTEPLADLRVRTYDGQGNVDIGISYYSPPTPTFWWEESFEEDMTDGKEGSVPELETWSTGPGNEEEVHLFDLEPGLYYITAYSFRNAREFTIVADFVYPPENVDPDDAITLTPGIEYGLLSGYEGLNQYFKVEVPQGTERLVVDLNDGAGDASLYMRLDQAPTTATYEHHSTAEGANDRIAFNDPTPGWWYILLTSESAFTGVNIVAEFADRYVWDYDGTPIELYNDEPLDGISVAKSGEISFFANLEEPGSMLWLETYGGSGDIMLYIEGQQYEIEFSEGGGRPGPGAGFETVAVDFDMMSGKEGTNHMMSVESPLNGQIDITMTGISDAEEISIVVRWDESDFPVEPIEPIAPAEPGVVESCTDVATEMFEDADADGDGVLDERETKAAEIPAEDLKVVDVNKDGSVEYREALQFLCTCDNELMMVFEAFALGREEVSLKALESHSWSNDYDFASININDDEFIDEEEIELLVVLCETTFDAFDGDGDGVPDVDDAFPEDPTESKDTDGDGVGDNADIVASVSNDIIYASAGAMLLILAGLLLGFLRTNRSSIEQEAMWDGEDRMTEAMFSQSSEAADYQKEEVALPDMPDSTPTQEVQASIVEDVFSIGQPIKQQPPSELMGMVLDGIETIEFPTGSGEVWVRASPDDLWLPKQ